MYKSIRRAYLNKRNKPLSDNNFQQYSTPSTYLSTTQNNIKENKNIDINKSNNINKYNKINYKSTNHSFISDKKDKYQPNHENNLKTIENLKKELKNLEKENELLSRNIIINKDNNKKKINDYNKVINDIESEKKEVENLKEITISKKRYFLHLIILKNQGERALNIVERIINSRNNNNNRRNNRNELNRNNIRNAIERLVDLYRRRRDNEDDPPIPYEQLQSLPSSAYPRNNRRNEKCIICGFVFCFNDIIIKLTRCNHIFHKNCLVNRLTIRQTSKCPICKISII